MKFSSFLTSLQEDMLSCLLVRYGDISIDGKEFNLEVLIKEFMM